MDRSLKSFYTIPKKRFPSRRTGMPVVFSFFIFESEHNRHACWLQENLDGQEFFRDGVSILIYDKISDYSCTKQYYAILKK